MLSLCCAVQSIHSAKSSKQISMCTLQIYNYYVTVMWRYFRDATITQSLHTHTHTQIELKWKAFHVFLTKLNCTWLQHVLLFSSTTIFAHVTTAFAPCPGLAVSALLCSFVLSHVLFSIRINIFETTTLFRIWITTQWQAIFSSYGKQSWRKQFRISVKLEN